MERIDVNAEKVTVGSFAYSNGDCVAAGAILFSAESTKAVNDISSEQDGLVLYHFAEGTEVSVGEIVVSVFETKEDYTEYIDARKTTAAAETEDGQAETRVTEKAKKAAQKYKVDLARITKQGVIKEADVLAYVSAAQPDKGAEDKDKIKPNPHKKTTPPAAVYQYDRERIVIVGAGKGAEVLVDMVLDDYQKDVVLMVDDKVKHCELFGRVYPVSPYGVFDFPQKADRTMFDTVIITMSANLQAMRLRKRIFDEYVAAGLVFTNVIAKSAELRRGVVLGSGNVIGGGAYIGAKTEVGNNNMISYHVAIGHHNVVGSHILLAPGVVTSGSVKVGDGCIIPAGVGVINRVSIGENVVLPVGYSVIKDIESGTVIKS